MLRDYASCQQLIKQLVELPDESNCLHNPLGDHSYVRDERSLAFVAPSLQN
jgi:hypothetical protein